MTNYNKIFDVAVENHGLITSEQAKKLGIPLGRLADLAHRGRLSHLGHGVYQLVQYRPAENDTYAQAVALVGHGAYLYGESVIALLGLAPTNPDHIYVAAHGRVRRNSCRGISITKADAEDSPEPIDGIPAQSVCRALLSARRTMPQSNIRIAADEALRIGRITEEEREAVENELIACIDAAANKVQFPIEQ